MSRSLSPPWILSYVLDVAVTRGGDLSSTPLYPTNRKVQLIKFLTHQVDDSWLWARISDTMSSIPVRFSKESMVAYKRDPVFGSTPIHDFKTVFITIKKFRPMLVRVPLGPGAQGMSTKEHIVLEVNTFEVKGSCGAEVWGIPRDIELHEDVRQWAEGLRQGGGAGNILKLKQQEKQQQQEATVESDVPDTKAVQKTIRHAFTAAHRDQKAKSSNSGRISRPRNEMSRSRLEARKQKWHAVCFLPDITEKLPTSTPPLASDLTVLSEPPIEPRAQASKDTLGLSPSLSELPAEERPTTPSNWSPSQRSGRNSSPVSQSAEYNDNQEAAQSSPLVPSSQRRSPMIVDEPESPASPLRAFSLLSQRDAESSPGSSQVRAVIDHSPTLSMAVPTPAQRPKPIPPTLETESSTLASDARPPSDRAGDLLLLWSSSATGTQSPLKTTSLSYAEDADPDTSGPGRILVPNSDTSGTVSQPSQPSQRRRASWVFDSQTRNRGDAIYERQDQPVAQSLSYTSQSQSQGDPEGRGQSQVISGRITGPVSGTQLTIESSAVDGESLANDPQDAVASGSRLATGHKSSGNDKDARLDLTGDDNADVLVSDDDAASDDEEKSLFTDDEQDESSEGSNEEEIDLLESIEALKAENAEVLAMIRPPSSAAVSRSPTPELQRGESIQASPAEATTLRAQHPLSTWDSRAPALPTGPDVFMSEASFSDHMDHIGRKRSASRSIASLSREGSPLFTASTSSRRRSVSPDVSDAVSPSASPALTEARGINRNPYHDAEACAAPSFLRAQPTNLNAVQAASEEDRVQRTKLKRKRSADISKQFSPGLQQDRRPKKKARKMDSRIKQEITSPAGFNGSAPSVALESKYADFLRASSVATTSSGTSRHLDLRQAFLSSASSATRLKAQPNETLRYSASASGAGGWSENGGHVRPAAIATRPRRLKLAGFKLDLELTLRDDPRLVVQRTLDLLRARLPPERLKARDS